VTTASGLSPTRERLLARERSTMSNANERPERAVTIHEFGEAENNSPGTSTRLATALRYGEAGLPIVPLHGTKNGRCT